MHRAGHPCASGFLSCEKEQMIPHRISGGSPFPSGRTGRSGFCISSGCRVFLIPFETGINIVDTDDQTGSVRFLNKSRLQTDKFRFPADHQAIAQPVQTAFFDRFQDLFPGEQSPEAFQIPFIYSAFRFSVPLSKKLLPSFAIPRVSYALETMYSW